MMNDLKRLFDQAHQRAEERTTYHGLLGKHNTDDTIDYEVAGRADYLFVTMPDGTVIIARNEAGVAQVEDMQVKLKRDRGTWIIQGRSTVGSLSVPTPTPASGVPPHRLEEHSDVSTTPPVSGDVVQFNDFDNLFHFVQPNTLGLTLDDLNGVTITAPTNGDLLAYSGGDWINAATVPVALAATIHAATPKATPVGADVLGYLNSAASFALVEMTFTQLLAYLAIPTLPVKATGAEVDTGTDDAKFVTPKAMEDSSYIKAAYADAKVADSIADGVTTIAPSQNAVFDALALKIATSVLDTDGTLAANSDAKIPSQKAIKTYVDAIAQGLDIKGSVRVATTANITLSGTQTIDGVAVIAGDRVLVKDQTTGANNGIYVVAAGAWSRATDADSSAKVTAGMFTFVSEGTVNGDNGFALTTNDPIVLATTVLAFTQVSGAGQIVAGNALTKTGNQLDWVPDGSTLEVASDQGRVKDAGITNAKLANMAANTVKSNITGSPAVPADNDIATLLSSYSHSAASKATPVGADEWYYGDSAATPAFTRVRATITQMLAWLGSLFAVLAGTAGGQTLNGGNAANDDLTLRATAHATKTSAYLILQDTGGKVVIGSATPGSGLFSIRGVPASTYGFETEVDSAGRGFQVITTDYVAGSVGSAMAMQLGNGTGDVATQINAYITGKAAAGDLLLQSISHGNVGIDITPTSKLGIKAGASSNDAAVGGVLYVDLTTHGNGTTVETTLSTYTLPADSLAVNGQSVTIEAWGTNAANGNAKTINLYFGATTMTLFSAGVNGGYWHIRCTVFRTGAATQKAVIEGSWGLTGAATFTNRTNYAPTETLSGAIVIKTTGQGGATNDLTQVAYKINWEDNNT